LGGLKKSWILSILFTNEDSQIPDTDYMMKNFELNNEKTFNSEAWNYFQTFDSKRTDKNYVCDWIDSREIISSID